MGRCLSLAPRRNREDKQVSNLPLSPHLPAPFPFRSEMIFKVQQNARMESERTLWSFLQLLPLDALDRQGTAGQTPEDSLLPHPELPLGVRYSVPREKLIYDCQKCTVVEKIYAEKLPGQLGGRQIPSVHQEDYSWQIAAAQFSVLIW